MECVIFDMDGTLSLVEHRRHFVRGQKKDWDAFYEAMVDDSPNIPVIKLYRALWCLYPIIVCSGRPSRYRAVTMDWLSRHGIQRPTDLFMRPDGDYREDSVVKREMLQQIKEDGWLPIFTVDDRDSVVNMWRDEGLVCLQCAPNDFVA